ncbi:MAG: NAD(P)-dependent oxidoreductase [Rhodospirillales bacterium]|nr:NAD(P)-dependent oxidoreductase [Rhodospirillales bacterium]MDE2198372.1 NAD(P)-dependent oxidoreductase [Rhodospirillales bacterium]
MLIRSVAIIGVGSMGAPIARRIAAGGLQVTVCDIDAASTVRLGLPVAATPRDCATSDLVIVLVASPPHVREVVLGAAGICAAEGRRPLVAIMSTTPVALMHELQAALGADWNLVDAPISGGVTGAEQGHLSVMVGGDARLFTALRPALTPFASGIFHCGSLGAGQAVKIANNVVGVASAVLAAEAYRLAAAHGLEIADAARIFEAGSGRSAFTASPDGVAAKFGAMARDRRGFEQLIAIMRKDIGFASEMAHAMGGDFPGIAGLLGIINSVGGETFDTWRRIAGMTGEGH